MVGVEIEDRKEMKKMIRKKRRREGEEKKIMHYGRELVCGDGLELLVERIEFGAWLSHRAQGQSATDALLSVASESVPVSSRCCFHTDHAQGSYQR